MIRSAQGLQNLFGEVLGDSRLLLNVGLEFHQGRVILRQFSEPKPGGHQIQLCRLHGGAEAFGLQPQGCRRNLHCTGIDVDSMQCVGNDVLHDRPIAPLGIVLLAPLPGFLLEQRQQQPQRHHQEVARAHSRIEDLPLSHGIRSQLHDLVWDLLIG